jgi:putative peptidoglycan lipid II flippase
LGPIEEPPPPTARRQPSVRAPGVFGHRRRNLIIGVTAAGAVILVALLVLASILNRMFDLGGSLNKDQLGLNTPTSSTSSAASSAPAGSAVKPTKATVFSPGGEADNPGEASQAIDGNPGSVWHSDTYSDAVPFPSFKNGVGLILQLPQPTVVGAVSLDVSSTGTKVEIRSSPTANPSKLEDTTVLTPATALKPGHNTIPVKAGAPTSNLLVWISTLGTTNGKSEADVSEISVQAAS